MKLKSAICLVILCCMASCSRNLEPIVVRVPDQSVLKPDISLQYTYLSGDSLQLFLLFEDRHEVLRVEKAATQLSYGVRAGMQERDELLLQDTLAVTNEPIIDKGGSLYLTLKLPDHLIKAPNVLHLQLWHQLSGKERMGVKFWLPLNAAMLEKQHVLVDAKSNRPVIRNYATTTDLLKVIATDSTPARIHFIEADFTPALPPMSVRPVQQNRTLQVTDSLTILPGDTTSFSKEGLYLLWADKPYAHGLLVRPWAYPQVTMAKELIDPLIYLTTSQEREKLFNAADPKKAVDAFWQQTGGNTAVARELIKTFYGRVERANRLFTSHKEGWATDRGMIYIVFGQPDAVDKVDATETWTYRQTRTRPYIKFVFTKKQNNFTENHYELVRLRDYQEVWYSTVAKWRAGITEM